MSGKITLEMECRKCGTTLQRQLLLAMACDAGAEVIPVPSECSKGGHHDFVYPEQAKAEREVASVQ